MINKRCIICDKEFTTEHGSRKLCYDIHVFKCSVCGEEVISTDIPTLKKYKEGDIVTCSNRKCRYEGRKLRSIKKYGVESHLQLPSVREKIYDSYIKNRSSDIDKSIVDNSNVKLRNIVEEIESRLIARGIYYDKNVKVNGYTYDFVINGLTIINTFSGVSEIIDSAYVKNYVKVRTENALRLYSKCINVFNWDDVDKVVSLAKSRFLRCTIYARKCSVREIDTKECSEFLNRYHTQGTCRYQSIRVGIYSNERLIGVMTFGKPRYNKSYEYELLRLCIHPDYNIVGGSCKMLKYFINNYHPKNIISYCDVSKFNGKVYKDLGFKYMYTTSPRRHWYKGSSHVTDNLLNQHGYDHLFGTDYGKGYSNAELMRLNGWRELYDCGQSTYVLNFEQIDQKT